MRLLKAEKSGWILTRYDFSLTQFAPRDIPSQYAILSHRWGPDEVTFKDIENGTAKTKAGYRKLEFCRQQAARDGLLYFWIDTCCIDKTNSTELSEAINSMFKWYKNATRCYVYLPDVSAYNSAGGLYADREWESALQKSQWFTRGWTLQELIAPPSVEFFSVEGDKLGNKSSLEQQIHEISGIAVGALRGESTLQFDVEERFSWAARRQTTIEEDAVYCLLGIFNVHIPLIYGEGQRNAMARLKKEIGLYTSPGSLGATEAPWIVPFEKNPRFTGRESQLAELERKLLGKDHVSKIAITGLGGVGKTQLVLEFLHKVKERRKDCSVIWIPATNNESLQQGYLKAAQQLKIPGHDDKTVDIKKLVQQYLNSDAAGLWVLVFDNADDLEMWTTATPTWKLEHEGIGDQAQTQVREPRRLIDCLPRSKQGCTIFTTRDRRAAVRLAQQNIIELSELDEEVALKLLRKSLVNPNTSDDLQGATALLRALTCLPLAIMQAVAYINENGITFTEYLSLLEEKEEQTIDLLSEDFEDEGRYRDHKNPVISTWLISFERIRRDDHLAADYLSFIACIDPRDIPQSLLPPGPSRKREIEAIGTLTAYSFVTRQPLQSKLDLHRLVHLAMRNWLRREGQLRHWSNRSVARLEEVFPNSEDENRIIWRTYLPHVRKALESDEVCKAETSTLALMLRYGRCLKSDGRWDESEPLFVELLAIETETLGEDSTSALTAKAELASTYWDQGRYKEAEELGLQVVATGTAKLGPDNLLTLRSMRNLALTYWNQGRYKEAEELQAQTVEIGKKQLGPDDPDTLRCMINLAVNYYSQGRYAEAEELARQALGASKVNLGPDHRDTYIFMENIATIYSEQGRYKEAEEIQVQILEAEKAKFGPDHPETLCCMLNLAWIYHIQGRYKEAEELGRQSLEAIKTKFGHDHLITHRSKANIAATYAQQGRYKEAEKLQVQVLEAAKRLLGPDHPDTLLITENLARTYSGQGRCQEAEELQVQILEARKVIFKPDHPAVLITLHDLALTRKQLGQDAEAVRLMRDCLEGRDRVLGAGHPHSLSSRAMLERWEAKELDGVGKDIPEEDTRESSDGSAALSIKE